MAAKRTRLTDYPTKADLQMVADDLRREMGGVRGEVRGEIGEVRREIGEVRGEIGEVRREIGEVRGEVRREIGEVRGEIGEVRGEIGEVRGEIGVVRQELGDRIDSFETKLSAEIRAVGVMVERMDTKVGVLVEGLSGFALKSEVKVKELDERHSAQIALLEDVVRESAQGVRKR